MPPATQLDITAAMLDITAQPRGDRLVHELAAVEGGR